MVVDKVDGGRACNGAAAGTSSDAASPSPTPDTASPSTAADSAASTSAADSAAAAAVDDDWLNRHRSMLIASSLQLPDSPSLSSLSESE